ncbi:MAG: helix-turn-helix transcriptional regulator [Verrucomicrobia bacterium]|nr:helix-turn-helix transcriptional regulator [Verrucomicrobiota bacterium]
MEEKKIMTQNELINILNRQRLSAKLSIRSLAEKAHCNRHTLTHWFSGDRKLTQIAILIDIANTLNLEIELKEKR